jgi:hypothetical protein
MSTHDRVLALDGWGSHVTRVRVQFSEFAFERIHVVMVMNQSSLSSVGAPASQGGHIEPTGHHPSIPRTGAGGLGQVGKKGPC